ncbi:Regulatory protein SoxS [Aquisphaera giovannonii]|uniref:Regulatory protein SoxS n=1 Tax=Aquisphaera giovannonii TaxID=406548 RepID=A0A5B9W535_9BACT|nr:AraC family transcriptional regulator [Aquisphaera giovannonii]QEH35140.1 Regulatory protein SoxS [Aquisphaera giovannonii]
MRTDPAAELFARLAEPFTGEALFDRLDGVVYFVKNERAEYVLVNRTLVERCGASDKSELIGRTAEDLFPAPLGRTYREQDEALIRSGEAISGQLELHLYPGGRTGWCLTNKLPLRDRGGQVVGLVGSSQDLRPPAEAEDGYDDVARAVQFARDRLEERPSVEAMAEVAGLSAYQLDRRIRRLFGLTPGQLLLKLRIDAAAEQLRHTDRPAAQVALSCGYSDQSAFSRQFRRTIGLTPLEYREAYRPGG